MILQFLRVRSPGELSRDGGLWPGVSHEVPVKPHLLKARPRPEGLFPCWRPQGAGRGLRLCHAGPSTALPEPPHPHPDTEHPHHAAPPSPKRGIQKSGKGAALRATGHHSVLLCSLGAGHGVRPTLAGREFRLCSFKGGTSKNRGIYFQTPGTATSQRLSTRSRGQEAAKGGPHTRLCPAPNAPSRRRGLALPLRASTETELSQGLSDLPFGNISAWHTTVAQGVRF